MDVPRIPIVTKISAVSKKTEFPATVLKQLALKHMDEEYRALYGWLYCVVSVSQCSVQGMGLSQLPVVPPGTINHS